MDNLITIFNQEAASASFSWWLLLISFLGGVVSSLSPCTLGILPIIIGYIAGYSKKSGLKTFIQMMFFILGMAFVLTSLGLLCAIGGKILINKYAAIFGLVVNSVILLMGLNLIGVLEFQMPVFIKQMPQNNGHDLILYPLIVGAVFALASTPCSTPILAGIMGFASLSANLIMAGLMLFLFSIGQGMVIVLAGGVTSILKGLKAFSRFSSVLMKISGFILVFISLFIYWKIFSGVI